MKKILNVLCGLSLFLMPIVGLAEPPSPPGGMGSSNSSSNISYTGSAEIIANTTLEDASYSSVAGSENALLVSGGTSTITNISVTKSGDASGDSADFYGTNAAILVYNGATLNLEGGTITTDGSHANGVFAYGTGIINISDATINTSSNNSGGIMVTGGGTLNANNLNVKTLGNSSAAIRSDRGGGDLTIIGGTYETSGTGSPAIYSTANIVVKEAALTSTSSEGIVVEGANSVSLDNVKLIDTNTTLNGNSETYKNIFLYQSMSGDADEGVASFTSKDSSITTNKGDTIFVTNTTATISLENNTIMNNDGDFLRVQSGKWGSSGSNGGNVTLNLINQTIEGNIIVDSISTLNLNMTKGSIYKGIINSDNSAKELNLTLSSDSVLVLNGDTYVTSLTNTTSDNSNIYLNGYKLYVDGNSVIGNNDKYVDNNDNIITTGESTPIKEETTTAANSDNKNVIIYIIPLVLLVFALVAKLIIEMHNKK